MNDRNEKYAENPFVEMEEPYVDSRGEIIPLFEDAVSSSQVITSKKGSIRANHYHKTDSHYCYMVSGSMNYYHRAVGADSEPVSCVVKAGQLIFTPPMLEHAMEFLEDSVFINFAENKRDQKSYEDDLVRVELIK